MAGLSIVFSLIYTLVLRVIQMVSSCFLAIIYRRSNDPLIPIREDCLLSSATSLAARIRSRKIKSAEVVRAYIRRIEDINSTTNSVVADRFELALKEAEAVDRFLAETDKSMEDIEKETPFLGVPFSVKDGIAIKGMIQSAGVVARKNELAMEDADVVALLRAAGAIPLALTNVPELMAWWETNSRLHGRAKNPYHSERMVGGSSGGEAALNAAAGTPMGVGTDIGGSIRIPSNFCGVFGHKPSMGLVPEKGVYPGEKNEDKIGVIGPISKFAGDLAPMLKVMSKGSKIDLRLESKVEVKNLRYFYMDSDMSNAWTTPIDPVHSQVKKSIKAIVDYFYKNYGITVEKVTMPQLQQANDIWWAKMMSETGPKLVAEDKKSNLFSDLIRALAGASEHTMEIVLVKALQSWQAPYGSNQQTYLVEQADKLTKEFQALLRDDGIFFYPTHPTPAMKHGYSLFHPYNFAYTAVFNATNMPVTQCPITQTDEGLPIGVQVVAAQYQDRLTLAVAEELEKAFGGWKPPPSQPRW